MTWRRLFDLLAVCLTGIGLWGIAVFLWPVFGPVGIVVVILVAVLVANMVDASASLLRKPSEHGPGSGEPPADSPVAAVSNAHK